MTKDSQPLSIGDGTLGEPSLPLALANETDSSLGTREAGIEAIAVRRFNIPGPVVAEAVRDLDDRSRAAIRWFWRYCHDRNLSKDQYAKLLMVPGGKGRTYSGDSIYQLLTGRRMEQGVDLTPMIEGIEAFRAQVEAPSRVGQSGFIPTRTSQAIWDRCDKARERHKALLIFGESQIGKSEAVIAYTKAHDVETTLVEAPSGGSASAFFDVLREKLVIGQTHRAGDLRKAIISCFDKKSLLIVDEAHRFLHCGRGLSSLDFIRELFNRAGCGIVLVMTDEGKGYFMGKGAMSTPQGIRLKQIWRRRIAPLVLPTTLPADDLARFAAAHGLDPAPGKEQTIKLTVLDDAGNEVKRDFTAVPRVIEERVCREEGLGVWLTILQDARDLAKEKSAKMSWGAVLRAYCASLADMEVFE